MGAAVFAFAWDVESGASPKQAVISNRVHHQNKLLRSDDQRSMCYLQKYNRLLHGVLRLLGTSVVEGLGLSVVDTFMGGLLELAMG